MATALQAQLAQLATTSTNPLDLKAQRKAHAESLVFEPAEAASQDFETLFEICNQGFRDLLSIDSRFAHYGRTIFSGQSKEQDRTQLTAAQNKELDSAIESFLTLVASRLHLRPAILTVEWLVRRFKIHRNNTSALLFTVLPYYNEPAFATLFERLLEIVPSKLPDNFRFLRQSKELVKARKHATSRDEKPVALASTDELVLAAVNNTSFFTSFSDYTVTCCSRRHGYDRLTALWATVVTRALAAHLDMAESRQEARQQKEEDIVRRILTIVNDALELRGASNMRTACHTILAVLVTKTNLSDRTLDLLMDAISKTAKPIEDADLICLAVISQHRQGETLPSRTCEILLRDARLAENLVNLQRKYDTTSDTLSLGLLVHACYRMHESPNKLRFVERVVQSSLLQASALTRALATVVNVMHSADSQLDADDQQIIRETLHSVSRSETLDDSARQTLADAGFAAEGGLVTLEDGDDESDGSEMEVDEDSKLDTALSLAAKQTVDANPTTFLSSQASATYDLLARTALLAGRSQPAWSRLSDLKCFHIRSKDALYPSFLLRFSSSMFAPSLRATAFFQLAKFSGEHTGEDFQLFLPYLLVGLSDASSLVRKAAIVCMVAIKDSIKSSDSSPSIFAKDTLYSVPYRATLKPDLARSVYQLLTQNLEEYRLDGSQAGKALVDILTQTKQTKAAGREELLAFIAASIEATPMISVRIRLLQLLLGVTKVGNTTKTKSLLNFIRQEVTHNHGQSTKLLLDSVPEPIYWMELLSAISAGSSDGLKLIRDVIVNENAPDALRQAAMQRLVKLWSSIKPEKQVHVAEAMFDVQRQASQSLGTTLDGATDALRSVNLSTPALRALVEMLPSLCDTATTEMGSSKRRKTENGRVDGSTNGAIEALQQWSFVLELVDHSQSRDDRTLLQQLNHLLTELHSLTAELGSQIHYVEAILLDSLTGVVSDISKDTNNRISTNTVSVDVVVAVFQTSPSAQVQRSALSLISTLARAFPDTIMHHVMPVFTRMGQSILQHGDEFSVHVADLAIKSIIPPLLASFREQKSGLQEAKVRVLLSFVVSYDHIPADRRLPLFSSLIKQLGSEGSLYLLVLLFVDKHGRSESVGDFLVGLLARYDPVTQIQTLKASVDLIRDACQETPTSLTAQIIPSKDRKARMSVAVNFLNLAVRFLQHSELHRNLANALSKDDIQASNLRQAYTLTIEHTLRVGRLSQSHKKASVACSQMVDALLSLVPIHETINGMEPLLAGRDLEMHSQVLRSIEQRVSKIRVKDEAAQKACIRLLPRLQTLLQDNDEVKLTQTILSCTDSIIERFGKKDVEVTTSILRTIASANCLLSENGNTQVLAFFCLATAFQTLGEGLVPLLPNVLKLTFQGSERYVSSEPNAAVLSAALAMLAAIFDNLSPFVTKGDVEKLLRVCSTAAANDRLAEDTSTDRTSTLDILAKRREESDSQDCISALSATWPAAMDNGANSMMQHLHVLQTIVSTINKKTAAKLSQSLLAIFLQVLDTGTLLTDEQSPRYDVKEVEQIEDLASQIMVQLVYKLNDSSFRPLFLRMLEWSTEPKEAKLAVSRHAALYKFLHHFFDTLKSIVTGYAGMAVDDASAMLQSRSTGSAFDNVLWVRVLQTLHAAFEHDQDEYFQAPSRFETICGPLIAQLERATELNDDVREYLTPCIVSFTSAADSSENQKAINNALLMHLRSEHPQVRLATLACQRQLTETLSDEWLAHLPEMLPFISEALEDDDEDVQNETRAWVSKIEAVIGESLTPMLQ